MPLSRLNAATQSVGNVMTTILKLSKDNVVFAVRAVDRADILDSSKMLTNSRLS
jgi:hypothetical protein